MHYHKDSRRRPSDGNTKLGSVSYDRNPIPLGAHCLSKIATSASWPPREVDDAVKFARFHLSEGVHRDTVGPHETCFVVLSWILYYTTCAWSAVSGNSPCLAAVRQLDLPALAPKIEWNLALGAKRPGSGCVRGRVIRFADVSSSNRFFRWIGARN